jgi:outer membrane protein
MKKAIILLMAFLIMSLGLLYSQNNKKWSLIDCIEYAMANNIRIKQQELNTNYTKNNEKQAKAEFYPNLNAGLSQSYNFMIDKDVVKNSTGNLSSSVTIFNGFNQINRVRKANYDFMASVKSLEKIKNDISLNIASAYLGILFNIELLNVAKEQLNISKQQVERTSKLYNVGSISKGRLLEIQATAASDELQVVMAQNNLDLSYLTLTQLLELDSVAGFEIQIPDTLTVDEYSILPNIETIYNDAINALPQIKIAEYNLKSAILGYKIAKSSLYPKLYLSGSMGSSYLWSATRNVVDENGRPVLNPDNTYVTENYPFNDQLKDKFNVGVSVNLNIPVFNNFYAKTSIDNSKIQVKNYEYELINQRNILYRDIQQAYYDAIAALNKFRATEKALEAIIESFRDTKQRYEVGMINTVDFNAAKTQLMRTESELLQAKYEYIFKTKILDFYRGIPINLSAYK